MVPPSSVFRASKYTFTSGELLLFDANIWLYLYGPPNDPKRQERWLSQLISDYSLALKRALHGGARILVDTLILSEYLNRYCRTEQGASPHKGLSFKDFRGTPFFQKTVLPKALADVRGILAIAELPPSTIDSGLMDLVLQTFGAGNSDFNDAVLAELCRKHGWTLVTHDGDFGQLGIRVLTENRRLNPT